MVDLSVDFAGVSLRNPVLLASGTCNYGQELLPLTDFAQLGGLVTKTITPRPRGGNAPQRIIETAAGMLNSIGLQNPGLEDFAGEKWAFLAGLDTQIVVNIAGFAVDEFGHMAARLEALDISHFSGRGVGMLARVSTGRRAMVRGSVRGDVVGARASSDHATPAKSWENTTES